MDIGSFDVHGSKLNFVDANPVGKAASNVGGIPETDAALARWFRLVCLAAAISVLGGIIVSIGLAIAGVFNFAYLGPAVWYAILIAYVYVAAVGRNALLVQIYGIVVLILQILVAVSLIINFVHSFVWFESGMPSKFVVLVITYYVYFLLSVIVWFLMTISAIWALNIHKEMTTGGVAASAPIIGSDAPKASYDAV
uniref:Uncharacterized protein n=1 Tax=Sexangularia sp. CB-2014 TaxID=1486929 RepID=A0A7S1V5Z6_9EUKA